MAKYYVLNITIGGRPKALYELVDTDGSVAASAGASKPYAISGVTIDDPTTGEKLKLKRRRIESDLIAQNNLGDIIYRMPLPHIIKTSQRRMFAIEDRFGEVLGETISASVLPKKSLLREKLDGFQNHSLILKDDAGIIYYTGNFPESPFATKEKQSAFNVIKDAIKFLFMHYLATRVPFIKTAPFEHEVFKVNNADKGKPPVLLMTYLFNEWLKETADM